MYLFLIIQLSMVNLAYNSFTGTISKCLGDILKLNVLNIGYNNFHGSFLPILSASKFRYINLFFFFKLRNIIMQQKATHLICEHPYMGWLGILAKYFCKTPMVIHSHNIEALRFKSTGKWWWKCLWYYERLMHRSADVNFFITDEDRLFAIQHFRLDANKCHTITYGFDFNAVPTASERLDAKLLLQTQHHIPANHSILLFNGTLDYGPNLDALNTILNDINPIFLENPSFKYSIVICGKGLPDSYQQLESYKNKHIVYAGFVDDISVYFKG
jgi:glycosyltransferase involved in cell wall biosynthesis